MVSICRWIKQITRNKLGELASRKETLQSYSEQVAAIQNSPDITDEQKQSSLNELSNDAAFNLGLNASRVGNTDILLKQLDQSDFQQQLIQSGVTTEETIKEKIPEIKKQIELADYLYNKHNNRLFESPVEGTVKSYLTQQSVDIEKRVADNNEFLKNLQQEHASILSKDPIIQANTSNLEFMNTLNVTAIRLAKLQAQTQLEQSKDDPEVKEQLTKVIDNLQKVEKEYPVTNMKNQAITNFNLVNNLAQQTLLTQFNTLLTEKLNTVGSKENIESIQRTANEVKAKEIEKVKQNKSKVDNKAKEDRIQNTQDKKDLLTATDVATKIVNRVDPTEQLSPEEQQFYDNNPILIKTAITNIQDLKEQEKSIVPVPGQVVPKVQPVKESKVEPTLPNPFEGGTEENNNIDKDNKRKKLLEFQNRGLISLSQEDIDLIKEVKNKPYTFTKTLRYGSNGFEVMKLQERLGIIPADGLFGSYTRKKVTEFQRSCRLVDDGIVGPATLKALNQKQSKLDLFCEAIKEHEGWYPGSRSYRNKNPGNIKYIGQKRAVGQDSGGFCIFETYTDGL